MSNIIIITLEAELFKLLLVFWKTNPLMNFLQATFSQFTYLVVLGPRLHSLDNSKRQVKLEDTRGDS